MKNPDEMISCKCGRMVHRRAELRCGLCQETLNNRPYPILEYARAKGCPETIPWGLVAPHERQADLNHYQSLTRLGERGGLSPVELYWVMTGHKLMHLRTEQYRIIEAIAVDFINEQIETWNARTSTPAQKPKQ